MSETSEGAQPAKANKGEWLTTGEAAAILGASLPTVRRMADNGTLVSRWTTTWSSQTEDRHGRRLHGHRRVTRASVMEVKRKRDQAAAAFRDP